MANPKFIERGRKLFESLLPIEDTLKDKKVVITGANSGLGYETAKYLGERGAHTIITARSESKAQDAIKSLKESNPGAKYDWILLDVTNSQSIKQCIHDFHKFAPVDCVVVNAGAGGFDQSRETFDRIMNTNVYGNIAFSEKSVEIVKEGGRIIFVESDLANPMFLNKTYWETVNKATSIHDPLFKDVPYFQVEGAFLLYYSTSKALGIKYCELASKDPIYTQKKIQIAANNPGWCQSNINNNNPVAPLKVPQGALSMVHQIATSENVNGGYYGFGHRFDINAPF